MSAPRLARPIACLIALLLAALLLSGALADGPAAQTADVQYRLFGTAGYTSCFFVTSKGNAEIVFGQNQGTLISAVSRNDKRYGSFHITCTASGLSTVYQWDGTDTYTLSLPNVGAYEVCVTPYSASELAVSNQRGFVSWTTEPDWWVQRSRNCTCQTKDPRPAPTAAPVTSLVTVSYMAESGDLLGIDTYQLPDGVQTITAPQTLNGYEVTGTGETRIYVNHVYPGNNNVTFYYQQVIHYQPVDRTRAAIPVYYRTEYGVNLSSETLMLTPGTHSVYPAYESPSYTLIGNTMYQVTVDAGGNASLPYLVFLYRAASAVTQGPTRVPMVTLVPQATKAPFYTAPAMITLAPQATKAPVFTMPAMVTLAPQAGNVVMPVSYDTQFKPGTAVIDNQERYVDMPYLLDNDINTRFTWLMYKSERTDDIPEFTFFFDGKTISGVGIRNGNLRSYDDFIQRARYGDIDFVVYDSQGNHWTESIHLDPDNYTTNYQIFQFSHAYSDVQRIEFWHKKIRVGESSNQYVLCLTDLQFYAGGSAP